MFRFFPKTSFAAALTTAPLLLAICATRPARAQADPPPAPPDALVKMTEAHRALESFSGVITLTNSKASTVEVTLSFRRPDRLRAVIVEKSKGKAGRGGPRMAYVDGKFAYLREKNKWTRKPFKAGDALFTAYDALIGDEWASDLFHKPVEFARADALSIHYSEKDGVVKGAPVTLVSQTYMNDQASIGYETSFSIGKTDRLLRERTYSTSANSPLHSWDEGQSAIRFTQINANPALPDSLFVPPTAAKRARLVTAGPSR